MRTATSETSRRPAAPERADVGVGAHEHAVVALEPAQPADRLGAVVVEVEERLGPGSAGIRARAAPPAGRGRNGSMRSDTAIGPGAGTAAAVGLGEGLVQVEVHDVEAHVPGPADAHDRVEVGAVVVERGAHVVDDPGDLLDPVLEQPERRGVGEHQAGHVVVGLGPQVVEVDVALRVGADLDHLVAGHRHRGGVGAVGGVGREHLGPGLAAVLVEGAREQHAGQLAVGARGGLERDVGQPGDLAQALLQAPHQLQRALGAPGVLERVQPGVAVQRRDALVQLGVVLHRARAQRIEAGVEVEVALGQAVVVAHDLGL